MRCVTMRAVALTLAVAPTAVAVDAVGAQQVQSWVELEFRTPTGARRLDSRLCDLTPGPIDGACGVPGLDAHLRPSVRGTRLRTESRVRLENARPTPTLDPPAGHGEHAIRAGASAYGLRDRITFAGFTPAYLRVSWLLRGDLMVGATRPGNILGTETDLFAFVDGWVTIPGEGTGIVANTIGREVVYVEGRDLTRREGVNRRGHADLLLSPQFTFDFVAIDLSLHNSSWVAGPHTAPLDGVVGSTFLARFAVTALDEHFRDVTDRARPIFASGRRFPTSVVPEPATAILLGFGLVGVAAATRRRRA